MNELFKEDKKEYESKWKDIGIFVKYGMISEEKFYEKAIEFALVESLDGKFRTIPEYQKFIKKNQTDKNKNSIILYTSDKASQDVYIENAKKKIMML